MSKAIVHAALDAVHTYGEKIAALQKLYKPLRRKPEVLRATLLPLVASYRKYAVPLVPGEGKAEGTKVLDSEHPKYEACRKSLSRLVADVIGEHGSRIEEPVSIPRAQRQAAKAYLAQFDSLTAAIAALRAVAK